MRIIDRSADENWLGLVLEGLRHEGCAVLAGVLQPSFVEEAHRRMYRVREAILAEVGEARLRRAGEIGVLRLMLKYDSFFLHFLEVPEILAVVDATVSPTAILHLQNGLILPSFLPGAAPTIFQTRFHMDFPRFLNDYVASVNVMVALDAFTPDNGGTLVVPGTHQSAPPPSEEYLRRQEVPVICPRGALIFFDSTLYHAAGTNVSGADRLAINHQFTRSWIKQQIDYVRALGDAAVLSQKPRTQQLLGWYTRVVTSLDEFYRPEEERLYRRGQG